MAFFLFLKAKKVPGVPTQKKGAYHDTESIKDFESADDALKVYESVKNKFLNINKWSVYCGTTLAEFKLYDCNGQEISRRPQKGDFVRINIMACPTVDSPYFWVRVQSMAETNSADTQKTAIIFQPSYRPTGDPRHIEHFYSRYSTSTFMISRENCQIKAAVYGRNEAPNLNTDPLNIMRNILTGLLAIVGLSKFQWKMFTDRLIDFQFHQ